MAAAAALAASPFDQATAAAAEGSLSSAGLQHGAEGALTQAASQPQPSGLLLPDWHNEGVLMGSCSLPGTRQAGLLCRGTAVVLYCQMVAAHCDATVAGLGWAELGSAVGHSAFL